MSVHRISLFIRTSSRTSLVTMRTLTRNLSNGMCHTSSHHHTLLRMTTIFTYGFAGTVCSTTRRLLTASNVPFSILLPLVSRATTGMRALAPHRTRANPTIHNSRTIVRDRVRHLTNVPSLRALCTQVDGVVTRLGVGSWGLGKYHCHRHGFVFRLSARFSAFGPVGLVLTSGSPHHGRLLTKLNCPFRMHLLDNVSRSCPSALHNNSVTTRVSHTGTSTCHTAVTTSRLIVATSAVIYLSRRILNGPTSRTRTVTVLHDLDNHARRICANIALAAVSGAAAFMSYDSIAFTSLASRRVHRCIARCHPVSGTNTCNVRR